MLALHDSFPILSERARQALRRMGDYKFAPALTVDETAVDRPLYKLIYLTRYPAGIKVFRDAHRKSLETQATYKSAKKAETRRVANGMNDMFRSEEHTSELHTLMRNSYAV